MKQQWSTKEKVLGGSLYRLMQVIGWLPSWWHYAWAYLIALVLQYLLRYRREVIETQLRTSYPTKSDAEMGSLIREVYHHLATLAVEYFMLAGFGKRRLQKHLHLHGVEQLQQLYEKGHKIVYLALGHYGNWEWFTGFQALLPFTQLHVLYKPQRGMLNYLMHRLRSKFGTRLIDKNVAPRTALSLRKAPGNHLLIFVADQTPSPINTHLFVPFLGRSTATFTGMERLANKLDIPILYLDVVRQGIGQYHCQVELLTEQSAASPFGSISYDFMRRLDSTIQRAPAYWLWSHRRWKHTPSEVQELFPHQEIKIYE